MAQRLNSGYGRKKSVLGRVELSGTVLVTGGAGYVGSHCCKAFAAAGWTVVAFDNLSRGWRDLVKWGPLIEGDLLDRSALESALRVVKPDAVAHFAAVAYVGESMADPALYWRTNVAGTLNLLEAMRAAEVGRLIFSSSCAVYGERAGPIFEEDSLAPINTYGSSKAAAERIIRDFSQAHGLKAAILRYFNAGGADPDLETGERHDPEPHVIPLLLRGALDPDFVFTVYGDDFDTPDGTCVRDYVHVSDLARAHLAALQRLVAGAGTDTFNLASGRGVSVKELGDAVERATGAKLSRRIGPRREGDPPILVASYDKAQRVLGWRPELSSIDDILRTALAWHEKDGSLLPRDVGARR